MHWIDIVLLVWVALSAFSGFRLGFVYKLGSLIGFFISIYLSSRFAPAIVERFDLGWTALVGIFFLLLSILTNLFGLVAWLIDKAFHIVYIIPLTKTANRIAGAVLSVLITCGIITATVYVASLTPWTDRLEQMLSKSFVAKNALVISRVVAPFVSDIYTDHIDTLIP